MTHKILSSRYARALINLSKPNNVEKVCQDLQLIMGIYMTDSDFTKILKHPLISESTKKEIITAVLKGKIEPLLIRFLETLIAKKRINLLPTIVEIYNLLADESLGIIRAKIKTPFFLQTAQQEIIIQKLTSLTKQRVIIDIESNPSLLGGLTIQIGDRVIDGSIQGRLKDLKEKLLEKV